MPEITDNTGAWLGLILFMMGTTGFSMCVIEIREIMRLNNIYLFKYFSLSHAIIHASAQIVVVVLYISSSLILGLWVPPHLIGYSALALQFSSLYTALSMSVNRMMSVRFTFVYTKVFTKSNTIMIVVVTWLFAFSSSMVLLVDGCSFNFNVTVAEFHFGDTECGRFLSLYVDIIYNSMLIAIVIPIDMYSLYSLHKITKEQIMSTRRVRREKPWFLQTLLNSLLFALMLTCFHTATLARTVVTRFFLTIVAWETWLMSPQIIGIIVQKECRLPYLKLFGLVKTERLPVPSTTGSKGTAQT